MAENWAGLAEAIGMRFTTCGCAVCQAAGVTGFWRDPDHGAFMDVGDALPAYLMQPEQTARILAMDGLPCGGWLIEKDGDAWNVERFTMDWTSVADRQGFTTAPTIGEAVARCAAGLV